MKIFTLYMARRFFKPFLFGLALFALLIFLGDTFDKVNTLARTKASLGEIMLWLWLEVPYWTVRVIPMATLLATLVAITGFVSSGEWIAVQASGFKTRDFWLPVLGCSLVVTAGSFLAQETLLPACYVRARSLWQNRIHPEWEWDKYADIALIGGEGEFIQAKTFLPKDGLMERPILEKTGPTGVESQLDAEKALWDGTRQRWVFYRGVERRFLKGRVAEKPFEELQSDLAVPPRNLIPRTRNPDEMSLRELRRYRERIAYLGESARELDVAAAAKVATPFANFVICALGIPVALRLRKAAKVVSFCTALGISFLYLWFIEIGRALGIGGQLPPIAAAWLPNAVFGGLAAWLIRRYDV